MKTIIFCCLALAILSSGSLATASLKKKDQKVILAQQEQNADNYTLQDLLALDVSNVPCADAQFYQDLNKRIDQITAFLSGNPEKDLSVAISALKQVKVLLKKVQEGIDTIEDLKKPQQPAMIQLQGKHDQIKKRLSKINTLLFPVIFEQLQRTIESPPSGDLDEAKKLIDEAINIVDLLLQKFQELKENSTNFPQYAAELAAKSESISTQLAECNGSSSQE